MTADVALHVMARILLRCVSLTRTQKVLARVARPLPELRSVDEVREALDRLGKRGTCLSRALTVGAMAPASELIIGVGRGPLSVGAHAWLEVDGIPLLAGGDASNEIARLSHPRAPRGTRGASERCNGRRQVLPSHADTRRSS